MQGTGKSLLAVNHATSRQGRCRFELNQRTPKLFSNGAAGRTDGRDSKEKGVSIQAWVFPGSGIACRRAASLAGYRETIEQSARTSLTRCCSCLGQRACQAKDGGVLRAKKKGETTVLIRAAGYTTMSVTVGVAGPVRNYPKPEARNYIDKYVIAKLRKFNILPSAMSGDEEFLRRVCLDATGTLPPPQRVREFVADRDPDKRDHLIETLCCR
jgi:hypothetical protein